MKRNGHYRVYPSAEEGQPGINLSRTLGDLIFHKAGLTCNPDVSIRRITSADKFIIIASDGVWDVFDVDKAIQIVQKFKNDPEKASRNLVQKALEAWTKKYGQKGDNITALVIFLYPLDSDGSKVLSGRDKDSESSSSRLKKKSPSCKQQ